MEILVVEINVHLGGVIDVDAALNVDACDNPAAKRALLNEVIDPIDTVDFLERHHDAEIHSSSGLLRIAALGRTYLDAPHTRAVRLPSADTIFQHLANVLDVIPLAIELAGFSLVGVYTGFALWVLIERLDAALVIDAPEMEVHLR